ncbi:beta-1,3-glucosyltransferase-like [Drosophila nasuta]|uniref:beta-1,3-glucosyltransferase-like n=1 Tax=Drosophila nasuta TaxID=42062 RepID=UPI00295EC964|nr:beta-1,3-glucosyltransferase-like [Drosophila nasuta]
MESKHHLLLIWFTLCFDYLCHGREILFVISCPREGLKNCRKMEENLWQQQQQITKMIPMDYDYAIKVHIMHELFNYWTLLDALPHLRSQTRLLNANTEWIIWCQQNTNVSSLRALLDQLNRQDAQEMVYYGHALYDAEATIVHHFAHYKNPTWFPYPMLSSGVVFTGVLLRSLAELVAANPQNVTRHSEFAIDAAHELARFIFDNLAPSLPNDDDDDDDDDSSRNSVEKDLLQRRIILKSAAYICPSANLSPAWSGELPSPETPKGKRTITTKSKLKPKPVSCMLHATPETAAGNVEHCVHTTGAHIYFAIKTCAKFHKERVPIIERTWAQDARQRKYYSDVADASIPTISTGIPNVATGHCAKTLAILQLSLKDIRQSTDIRWLVLVDDDTLLSVPRLAALLSCYNHTDHIYLGERYGYRLYAPDGFNYHTGGAGIVLSVPLVRLIVEHCSCPSPSAPDDMILGYCLQTLGVLVLHSSAFHQARPQDYSADVLQLNAPISFHKYLQTTPEHTYKRWLGGQPPDNATIRHVSGKDQQAIPIPLSGHGLLQLANVPTGLDGSTKHLDL